MRTLFAITRGAFAPESFRWISAPEIIPMNGLWEAAQTCPPGLLLRVRTNGDIGASLSSGDVVESVLGIVDSTTRWRAALALLRGHIAAIRNETLKNACWSAYAMMMQKHPASIMVPEREAAIAAIRAAVESLPKELMSSVFESQIARGVANFVMTDNDIDAARTVPFINAMILPLDAKDRPRLDHRAASFDVLASGVLMTEAHARLAERVPEWMFVPMPAFEQDGAAQQARQPETEGDDSGDDGPDDDAS